MLHLLLSFLLHTTHAYDPWEVLSADLTCCPQHATALECSLEGGSDCEWIGDSTDAFHIALAQSEGKNCFGTAYLQCKIDAGDVTACCSPGCKGITPPADPEAPDNPASVVIPECFQLPAITIESCTLGENYAFEGVPCQISGDPHTTMFNGNKHDFQGQPTTSNMYGRVQNQFYYIARCVDADAGLMPFQVLGTHYHWGDRPVSGIDHLTLELEDGDNKQYIYISSSIAATANGARRGVTSNFDLTYQNGKTSNLEPSMEYTIGDFNFKYTQDGTSIFAVLTYINPDESSAFDNNGGTFTFYMKSQMNQETDPVYNFHRYRMHYVYMKLDPVFKCAACGLCGNFKDIDTQSHFEQLETCDGSYIEYRSGWNQDYTPEAYDLFGWTYEKNFFNKMCGYEYDVTENYDNAVYIDPCDEAIVDLVKIQCDLIRKIHDTCCNDVIGATDCDTKVEHCYFDACVIATTSGKTQTAIENAVASVLGDTITEMCHNIPNVGEDLDEGNLATEQYLGCYKDSSSRAFEYVASWKVANKDIAACVDLCEGYTYMGLQWSSECFCSNEWKSVIQYGEADDSNCAGEGEWCTAGWTNCVYRISAVANKDKYKKKQFMSRIAFEEEEEEKKELEFMAVGNHPVVGGIVSNSYVQIGVVGSVVALAGISLYYAKCRNKDSKYVSIQ